MSAGGAARAVTCYCGSPARLKRSKHGPFWSCTRWPKCDGVVGCHPGTTTPLGKMADKPTREARIRAHDAFDALWKPMGTEARRFRGLAYRWLSEELGIDDPHMGTMDEATAARVADLCSEMGPEDIAEYAESLT